MKKCIFIGQAMPRIKKDPHDWPTLNTWLYSIGIKDEQIKKHFLYSALVDYFLGADRGSHKIPTSDEILKERKRLVKTITGFNPKVVVPVGRLSISYCLNQKVLPLKENIGKTYIKDPYNVLGYKVSIIPLPHPSGASTWRNKKENKKLLSMALNLLKRELNNK
jgi:uracil-DNA glycosylase